MSEAKQQTIEPAKGMPQPEDRRARAAGQAGLGNAQARGRFRAGHGAALHPLHLILSRTSMQGRTVDDYDAPLFLAWQLTNRCSARCLACCEESGPDKAWRDELSRDEALASPAPSSISAFPSSPSAAASRSASRTAGRSSSGSRRRRRPQARNRRQPHRRRRCRPDRGARRRVRADFRRRRHRGHAPARPSRLELRGGGRGDRAPGGTRLRAAVRLRARRDSILRRSSPPTISRPRSAAAPSSPAR